MIYTASYFGISNHHGRLIGISATMPRHMRSLPNFSYLAPSMMMVLDYKKGVINWEEYKKRYRTQLTPEVLTRFSQDFDLTQDMTLLCWCANPLRCHRYLVATWLHDNGHKVVIN